MASKVTENLIGRLLERDATGLRKYGVSLDRKDLTIEQWLDHQTEELLDGAGYAQSAKREIEQLRRKLAQVLVVLCTVRPHVSDPVLQSQIDAVLVPENQTPV
jgi:hypothetical protein